ADIDSRGREILVGQSARPAVVRDIIVRYGEIVGDLLDDRPGVVICDRVAGVGGIRIVRVGPGGRPPVVVDIVVLDGHAIRLPELETPLVAVGHDRAAVRVTVLRGNGIVFRPSD